MLSIQKVKEISLLAISILIVIFFLSTLKNDRPFFLKSHYHFNLVEKSQTNSNSSHEHKQFLKSISSSLRK